jgi:hypothetical protein
MTHNHGSKEWTGRPHFAPGQRLNAQALNAIMGDELRRERLTRVALHGHGVVFGYALARHDAVAISAGQASAQSAAPGSAGKASEQDAAAQVPHLPANPEGKPSYDDCGCSDRDERRLKLTGPCIDITCGLIIDRHGRELYWQGGLLGVHDLAGREPDKEGCYVLEAHYAERHDPSGGCGPCPTDHVQWIGQGVVFTLTWCKECPKCEHHPKCPPAECTTLCDYVCERTDSEHGLIPPADDLASICTEPGPLSQSRCGRWQYDAKAGVPIACVYVHAVVPEYCGAKYGFRGDPPAICSVRPFVYRTPLLYELIRGCHVDLARVESLSWQDWVLGNRPWNYKVSWQEFHDQFYSKEGFRVHFTKPVRSETLHERSIFLIAIIQELRADYWVEQRLPLDRIEPLDQNGAPLSKPGLAWGAQLVPTSEWITSEVNQKGTSLRQGAEIELTIRGQMVRDACGRMLDARPPDEAGQSDFGPAEKPPPPQQPGPDVPLLHLFGSDAKWSGQARPGGDFVATFRLAPRTDPIPATSSSSSLSSSPAATAVTAASPPSTTPPSSAVKE